MRHVFKSISKFIKSIFATPKWRYSLIAVITVLAVIISTAVAVVALNDDDRSVDTSDPIESYDKITEIEIVFDEETTADSDTAEPKTSEAAD